MIEETSKSRSITRPLIIAILIIVFSGSIYYSISRIRYSITVRSEKQIIGNARINEMTMTESATVDTLKIEKGKYVSIDDTMIPSKPGKKPKPKQAPKGCPT